MRRVGLLFIAAAASLGLCGLATAEPLVVPGIGPADAPAYNVPPPARPRQQPGRYGGGFLELLLTGHDPTPRVQTPARSRPRLHAAAPLAAPARPSVRPASYGAPPPATAGLQPVDSTFARQEVDYRGPEKAGTIIVDTEHKFLFLVTGQGRALRYGIGVGREGFEWHGVETITRKAEWPGWTPPPEMLERQPYLPRHMDGGPENPLGARALYLGHSLYRIHGTNQPQTIGKNVSSGCIRMMNSDVIDLYDRVKIGTEVVVM